MKKKIIILAIILVILIPVVIIFVKKIVPRYTNPYSKLSISDKTSLIVGTKDETERLVNDILIEGDKILFSYENMNRFIDAYITKDEKEDVVITNGLKHTKIIDINTKKMREYLQTDEQDIFIEEKNDTIYFDIKELQDIYAIDVNYIKETNTVDIKKDIHTYKIGYVNTDKTSFMKLPSKISVKIDKYNKGEKLYILRTDKEYYKVLDNKGRFGYVLQSSIENISEVKEYTEDNSNKKISLIWEYAEFTTPDRTGESKIDCINVFSPTWFELKDTNGNFANRVDYKYINWANSVGYEIWPLVSNGSAIITTSTVLNDYQVREKMVQYLLDNCKKYGFKGINMDFEYMYKADKDAYSQFIRELSVAFRNNGIIVSVDVTVPDGSDNYSLCYDRKAIGDVVDYVILMAYDQTPQNGNNPGSNAAGDWVETNIKKLLEIELEQVDPNKLVLAIPLYTRVWSQTANGDVKSQARTIPETLNLIRSNGGVLQYLEDKKQNYTEYYLGTTKYMIWVEDLKSIEEKLKLYQKYNLGGVAFWRKGYEPSDLWDLVNKYIKVD